jgi:hypothetical protein
MDENVFELVSKEGSNTWTYRVEGDVLHVSWRTFGNTGRTSHQLTNLLPDVSYSETFQGDPRGPFQFGLFGLTVALLTWRYRPVFEARPAVLIFGLAMAAIGFLTALVRMRKRRTTCVTGKDIFSMIVFDHQYFDQDQLSNFLARLRAAIVEKRTRQNTDSGEELNSGSISPGSSPVAIRGPRG